MSKYTPLKQGKLHSLNSVHLQMQDIIPLGHVSLFSDVFLCIDSAIFHLCICLTLLLSVHPSLQGQGRYMATSFVLFYQKPLQWQSSSFQLYWKMWLINSPMTAQERGLFWEAKAGDRLQVTCYLEVIFQAIYLSLAVTRFLVSSNRYSCFQASLFWVTAITADKPQIWPAAYISCALTFWHALQKVPFTAESCHLCCIILIYKTCSQWMEGLWRM